jgi:hypothetical protein
VLKHVAPRGHWCEMILESDDDRRVFLSVFDDVCETFNVSANGTNRLAESGYMLLLLFSFWQY